MLAEAFRSLPKELQVPDHFFSSPEILGDISRSEVTIREQKYILSYSIESLKNVSARIALALPQPLGLPAVKSTRFFEEELKEDEISMRSFHFVDDGRKKISIGSVSETRNGYEGKGFGTSLGMLSDEIIMDILRRHHRRFSGHQVIAEITDSAAASAINSGIDREGWSSSLALSLDYTYTGTNEQGQREFRKIYQKGPSPDLHIVQRPRRSLLPIFLSRLSSSNKAINNK